MITIEVSQLVHASAVQVCETLLNHQQLDRFFNAKITQVKAQYEGELPGGKGAVRQIEIGKIVFKEQIINASHEHICYRIIGKGPVSNHQGDIQLTPVGNEKNATQLDYMIKFCAPKWLPSFILKFIVGRDINKAMQKLAEHFS